jgi:hypothetical protein
MRLRGLAALFILGSLAAAVTPVRADPGYNPSQYFCAQYLANHYPSHAASTARNDGSMIFGGNGIPTAQWKTSSFGAFHVAATAFGGLAPPADSGNPAVNQEIMGYGTATAAVQADYVKCFWHGSSYFSAGSDSLQVTLSSAPASGTYDDAYRYAGVTATSWIDVRAYFYPIECWKSATYYGDDYYTCTPGTNYSNTVSQRVACWGDGYGSCTPATGTITLSGAVPSGDCNAGDFETEPTYCTGTYAEVSVYSYSEVHGDRQTTASASADGTIDGFSSPT